MDINDTVSLKLGNSGRTVEGQVAYLAESESTPGSYDAIVYLPPGEGAVGQSGTMTASSQSQSYPLTIPAKAVYTDNGISYVFVLRKQQGITTHRDFHPSWEQTQLSPVHLGRFLER